MWLEHMAFVTDPKSSPSDAEPGPVIAGRYVLSREIGRGSTGVVWDGRDVVSDQPVAVKILHTALLTSPVAIGRFRREVASAGALDHPNSVRVKTYGHTPEGAEYLVMERLVGRTLRDLLAEAGPLSQARAIRIIAQVLDAIAAAHRIKIIHRDLKPSNVILVETGREPDFVKVCDFGLAKVFDPDAIEGEGDDGDAQRNLPSMSTGLGILCGTPEFMAPEQARGEVLDGRADLYSVAVMLFQAVVGRLPFQGKTPLAVLSLHLATPPPRPTTLRPDLGIVAPLENLILRGLAKDRRERPSSAEVFRADLLQIERDLLREGRRSPRRDRATTESATLPAATTATSGARWKRSVLPMAAAVLVGALVLIGVLRVASSDRQRSAAPRPSAAAPTLASAIAPAIPPVTAVAAVSARSVDPGSPVGQGVPVFAEPAPRTRATKTRRPVTAASRSNSAAANTSTAARPTAAAVETRSPAAAAPNAETIVQRAEDLLAEGQGRKACALGETAVSDSPDLALVHGFLGRCYMRIGQPDQARQSYRRYLELVPTADDARFVRAILERKR
jgi:eukaryotic-like serine/threonine-protein kinase